MPRVSKNAMPSKILKELQRAALLVGLDTVYESGRMSDKGKKDLLYQLFHGDQNDAHRVSLIDHMFDGTSFFQESTKKLLMKVESSEFSRTAYQETPNVATLLVKILRKKFYTLVPGPKVIMRFPQLFGTLPQTRCVSAKRHWQLPLLILPEMEESRLLARLW
jgi:hypothetical protein